MGQVGTEPPIIAITMGDAAGIGPEIIMRALARAEVYDRCRPLVVGDAKRLRLAGAANASKLGVSIWSKNATVSGVAKRVRS